MAKGLTKDEKKALRQLEWQEEARKKEMKEKFKKFSMWGLVTAAVILAIAGLMWLVSQPVSPQNEAVNIAPITTRDISEGNKNAKVTVVEYADFQCPACAAYHPIITLLLEEYKDKLFYVYRVFPLTQIHPNAHISGQAAYAAHKQGAFFKYDDELYNNQSEWSEMQDPTSTFIDYAKRLKLDTVKFKSDMESKEAIKFINDSEQEALSSGINATPTFIVNGNKITNPNSLEEFKKIIDAELNKK